MKNIKRYSDAELALTVMNDEPLYRAATRRVMSKRELREFAAELFIFTDAQFEDLWQTVQDHHEERELYLRSLGN